jgi:hypothetical protein
MKRAVVLLLIGFAFCLAAGVTDAQICAGSHLNYYVRDAHGRLIDADANGLIYEEPGADPKSLSHWALQSKGTYHSGIDIPSDLATFDKTANKSLMIRGMCGFHGATDLKLTLNGKVMELHFALPDMGSGTTSADFTVDSMPFTPGKFQIDMTKPTTPASYGKYGGYFAASAWKPVFLMAPI